ncbi:putative WRKY transcription factor [Trifolium repens]|nr:putative WRKY transcription factor [Trifolium repens]
MINTKRFRFSGFGATNSLDSSAAQSPCFTIPSGISPTSLLDSPIMLPNSQAMPSPTTGSFAMLPPRIDEGSMLPSIRHEQRKEDASFKFKPQVNLGPNSLSPYHASLNQVSNKWRMMNEAHEDIKMLVQGQNMLDFSVSKDFANNNLARNIGVHFDNDVKMVNDMFFDTSNVDDKSTLRENLNHDEDIRRQLLLEEEQKEMSHATEGKTAEDGYNWRKYGQKQVKGSEYPRSYYKCTQPNCQVKKKVERSHDGQVIEIIYRGNHNHAIPHSSRRGSAPSNDEMSDIVEANETWDRDDVESVWGKDAKHDPEWKLDGQERDPRKRFRSLGMYELDKAEERYSTLANHYGDKGRATQAVLRLEDDAESKLKRRKKESYPCETMVPSRVVREPQVVVQIESEVDILDDGYRWRKYGQKVVKGNPNPRSYYKCTSARCTVRKHVERASHNLKYVITTYEGKHNHEVPTARNNNHISSNDIALPYSTGVNMQVSSIPKFDRKPNFSNEFMRSNLMGSFSNDINFGPSSMSQMKYSSLNNIKPYGAYGTSLDSGVAPQAEPIASIFPEFPMLLPLNLYMLHDQH